MIPRAVREQIGVYGPTDVEIHVDGAGVRIEPASDGDLIEEHGRLVIPPSGSVLTAETVEALRDADRR